MGGFTFRQEQDIIKEVVDLGCRLQQRHEHGALPQVHKVSHALHNLEGGAAVQAGADFVHEQRLLGPDHHLTCSEITMTHVVWCGVVWCGVVWCGVVWCGVVWFGVVWCGVVWSNVISVT